MRSKGIKLFVVTAFAAGSLGVASAPAQASTCAVADETLDYVVCDVIFTPAMQAACKVITKVTRQCFA